MRYTLIFLFTAFASLLSAQNTLPDFRGDYFHVASDKNPVNFEISSIRTFDLMHNDGKNIKIRVLKRDVCMGVMDIITHFYLVEMSQPNSNPKKEEMVIIENKTKGTFRIELGDQEWRMVSSN